jgi:FeS assembly SUF system regulator
MIRLSRLADYAVVLLSHMAYQSGTIQNAQGMAETTGLPLPTVSKLLSALARAGLLTAVRGAKGGYRLSREPVAISVADIIAAVDGPIALTQCLERGASSCEVETLCPSRRAWRVINDAVRDAFEAVSLAELIEPVSFGAEEAPWLSSTKGRGGRVAEPRETVTKEAWEG